MFRGSTPTHTFTLPFLVDTATEVTVCYKQSTGEYLEKKLSLDELTVDGYNVIVPLSQEDTLTFRVDHMIPVTKILAQVIVVTAESKVIPSDYIEITLQEILDEV